VTGQMPSTGKKDVVTSSGLAFPPEGYQATSVSVIFVLGYFTTICVTFSA